MIYYGERHETIDRQQESCLSLGCAGKFIAFIELLFYSFIFYTIKSYLSSKRKKVFVRAYKNISVKCNENLLLLFSLLFSSTIIDIDDFVCTLINNGVVSLYWLVCL